MNKWIDNGNNTISCPFCYTWFDKEREPFMNYCAYCGNKMNDRIVYEDIDEKEIRSFRDTMEFNYERERLRFNFKEFLKAEIKAQEESEEIEKEIINERN